MSGVRPARSGAGFDGQDAQSTLTEKLARSFKLISH
jgi:hypothetical protein